MDTSKEFVEKFHERMSAYGSPRFSPLGILEAWEQFVEFCEEGYYDNIEEYRYELRLRNVIESLLNDEWLRDLSQMIWWRERVATIDDRFRAILRVESLDSAIDKSWWYVHLPRYAGPRLAADIASQYGIDIEVRS